jgi:ATP-binding cassette subfamily B multidrug efflux pump
MLVAFIQYIQRIFVPIRELSGKVATIERALAALERVFGLLGEDESLPDGHHAPAKVRGALRLESVDFSYGGGVPVLRQLSLSVQPGEVVALVGPTGSGKSTVAKLLTRLYEPPAGRVLVDDVPVEQWQLQALRSAIGVVQQDVVLFSGTVADNIAMGRTLSDEALTAAVDGACMTDVVARLGGLQALLSESGGNLSAGERQLLSIARILALNPPVVILDEATASIDTQTEQKVQRAMERMFAGRTALVVAHRLSTIQKADRIAVLRRGELIQLGNHQALMAQDGLYRQLVEAAAEEGRLADKVGDPSGHS